MLPLKSPKETPYASNVLPDSAKCQCMQYAQEVISTTVQADAHAAMHPGAFVPLAYGV